MKWKKTVLATSLVLASSLVVARAQAASDIQSVIDETYVQPDYVLGYSLTEEQKTATLGLLGYSSQDRDLKTMTTSAYAQIMNVADDPSLQLYSSVKIQKLGASEPLKVKIVTPQNITKVTENMYRNAAVTLGIEHAQITVAAPIAVTGESALAGIYYSLEQNGAPVADENKALAQEELKALSDITAENQNKEGFNADKLNVALTDIKKAVADGGGQLTEGDVRTIVEQTLANYGLTSSITTNQINLIVNFALNLSKSGVITDADFQASLTALKDSIVQQAGSLFDGVNLNMDTSQAVEKGKGLLATIWQQIVTFFRNLIG
ncbi:DUF1002 domain-containing protein [Streptococcus cuniculipharyngis]|uniref:DUF1002 domain-containing protein n=1 Tax=Streptococcus cuniculipharyngis TaxID=1562651 RepID=A0A5C5SCT9_9STRE|nr:DUF1002 domain-containing protein [Streptococcus cuniculipharyngis]TWS98897.1 DUF1002 domain-containing protein [Streptococcus cuniculipharyngis]